MLKALRMAHATGGNDKSPAVIKRHLPKRVTVAELTALLSGASATNVHSSSGKYSLTAAGLARARQNQPRRDHITVT
jgi:hypothetical protein